MSRDSVDNSWVGNGGAWLAFVGPVRPYSGSQETRSFINESLSVVVSPYLFCAFVIRRAKAVAMTVKKQIAMKVPMMAKGPKTHSVNLPRQHP